MFVYEDIHCSFFVIGNIQKQPQLDKWYIFIDLYMTEYRKSSATFGKKQVAGQSI